MLLTRVQLTALSDKLHTEGRDCYCMSQREGEPTFIPKPKTRHGAGHKYPNGEELVSHEGQLGILQPPGEHGRAYLGIDPETGEIHCIKCTKKGVSNG